MELNKLFDIHDFESYRENNRIEVKKATHSLPQSLWETYSAMANGYGGIIILGAAENQDGTFYPTGLKNEAKLKKEFWDTINNPKKVSINLLMDVDVQTHVKDGNVILVITVPRARRDKRPVYINNDLWNGTFRRNWEGDYHCSTSEIRAMLRDEPEETMDMRILEDFTLKDLCKESVQGYRNYHSTVHPGHVWEKLPLEEYLIRIGAADYLPRDSVLHPTAAGLLMFGEEYRIVRYFPEYFLDYREVLDPTFRWTNRIHSSSGEWSGNLFDFFFKTYNKISMDIEKPFILDGASRIEDTPVHKAIREALANCIVNADFYLPRGIVIIKEQTHIIMQNPGSIRTGKDRMLRGGISDPRNKAIMKMFNLISIGERTGKGVPDIFSVWSQKGWSDPIVEEAFNPDRTTLILPFTKKQADKTSDKNKRLKQADNSDKTVSFKTIQNKKKIIDFLSKNENVSCSRIAEILQLSLPRTRAILAELTKEEVIQPVGQGRARRYILK